MPRATQSAGSAVVDFFRKSPLELAEFVMGLCKDALRERQQKSAEARARATEAVGFGKPSAKPKPAAAAAKAKVSHKKKAAKPVKAVARKVAKVKAAGPKKSHHKKVAPAAAAVPRYPQPGSEDDVVGMVVDLPEPEMALQD